MTGLAYAAGASFVVHCTGARLSREECERVRRYIVDQINNPSWSRESTASRERDLAAVAASWPEQQEDAA